MTKLATDNFKAILGAQFDPSWCYQLVFPTSLQVKRLDGWQLVHENGDEILGQTLIVIGKPAEAQF